MMRERSAGVRFWPSFHFPSRRASDTRTTRRPTIDTALYPFYHSGGSWNRQLWLYKNARVDELLDLARKTNDEGKRREIFLEFQKIVDETVPGIIAYSALHANGVRKDVEGFQSTPMQWLELKGVSLKR